MAYDIFVGPENRDAGKRDYVGSVDFHELPAFSRLVKRGDLEFVERMSNLFEDQTFTPEAIEHALDTLLPLMCATLQPDERHLLHKLIAMLSFASRRRRGLYGIAD